MRVIEFADRLEPVGILAGAFLVVVGIGTVVGMPWQTSNDLVASVIQLVGVVAMLAIGIGLARLSYVREE
ncbi:MAG: hypothetical protein V5A39_10275 [Haloarculaceae archaeon]|jgi:hypothetical protein